MLSKDSPAPSDIGSYPPSPARSRLEVFERSSSAELASNDGVTSSQSIPQEDFLNSSSLPPVDEGYAWVFLACAFTSEFLVWGISYAVGVFHDYWITTLFPGKSRTVLALTSTFMTGFMLMCCMAVSPIYARYPEHRSKLQYLGVALCALGLLTSGFAKEPWQVLVTIGMIYPLGGALYYFPEAGLLFDWFAKKRGLAAGIAYSSGGLGGAAFPFLIQALYDRFSYKTAMIAMGLGFTIPGVISVYYTRERIPVQKRRVHPGDREDDVGSPHRPRVSTSFLRSNTFYAFTLATFAFSLGNILPNVYLPTYVAALGLAKINGTALVATLNAASAAGLLILGHLTDKWTMRRVITIAGMGGALSTLLIWGFSKQMGALVAYAIVFGFFGLSFPSLWPRMITMIAKSDVSSPPIIISILLFVTGVGNVISGPIADAVLAGKGFEHAKYAYGVESYGPLLIWTGGVFSLGSLAGACYIDKSGDSNRQRLAVAH